MNTILSHANKILHSDLRKTNSPFIIRRRANLLHVCLGSNGCRLSRMGSCTMCNYGSGKVVSEKDISHIIERVKEHEKEIDSVLMGSYGSIFDTSEVPRHILYNLLDGLSDTNIRIIIFETHYTTVTKEILKKVSNKLSGKDIVIELGLESFDETVLEQCLNKSINIDVFKSKIDLIHDYGMSVSVNVFLGAPFLSVKEQINDSLNTILKAIDNGADNIVIFPSNIRENTLLAYLYENGRYSPISAWELVELLRQIPVNYHNKVYLSWFGDWDDEKILVGFYDCYECSTLLRNFFYKYLSINSGYERKRFVNEFTISSKNNRCYQLFKKTLQLTYKSPIAKRATEQQKWLAEKLNIKS